MEPANRQKSKAQETLKQVEDSPWVFLEISRVFYRDQKLDKAIKFVRQAIALDKDNGDCWVFLFKYLHSLQPTSPDQL
jgi:uncharacterized protein HemY